MFSLSFGKSASICVSDGILDVEEIGKTAFIGVIQQRLVGKSVSVHFHWSAFNVGKRI